MLTFVLVFTHKVRGIHLLADVRLYVVLFGAFIPVVQEREVYPVPVSSLPLRPTRTCSASVSDCALLQEYTRSPHVHDVELLHSSHTGHILPVHLSVRKQASRG